MELKTFIKNTLIDVVSGIEEANTEKNRFRLANHVHRDTAESGQKIEFDISVTVNETAENNVNGGIKVVGINIGGGHKAAELNQNINRIKFEVFITEK